ncbi:MAG: aminopeptidase P family protein [Lautropia sp.]|nr:aminopeptidase P family protein [Lautropia sp.]
MDTPAERLAALRQLMRHEGISAWIVPSADPHLSEYLPLHWQARRWLSGFTGSAATLVVMADSADLWADSRYWEQAEQQLAGTGIHLQKLGPGHTHVEHLAACLPAQAVVGVAADMLSLSARRQLEQAFATRGLRLRPGADLVAPIWTDRPPLPAKPIVPHEAAFVSESTADKLRRVREAMKQKAATHLLLSALDDIAWLTNLRGSDVAFNPVFLAHLLIGVESARLYVEVSRLDARAGSLLQQAGIELAPYAQIGADMASLTGTLMLDPAKVAVSTLQRLPASVALVESINPSTLFKSTKSATDIAHTREAMIQDGVALCGFFAEFEQNLADGKPMSELDVARMLTEHRSRQPHYVSPSFGTIAGFNANAALPHYSATQDAFSMIEGDGMLLIDSGGQYQNGTTDITRVVPVGQSTDAQRRDYTLVLKAHIALAETVFPENIGAPMLDAICRKPMWQQHSDYGHGTGHGVGYFLNVHEGPQVISYHAPVRPQSAMKVGMISSIEPGIYRPGQWGIRIENLVVNQPVTEPRETAFGHYLYFEPLTLCPIDTRLIERSLMTEAEVRWLDAYHALVRERLAPRTEGAAHAWLMERTKALWF